LGSFSEAIPLLRAGTLLALNGLAALTVAERMLLTVSGQEYGT
jgi:hypothetical protein